MTNHVDHRRRIALKATAGLGVLGFGGLASAGTAAASVIWDGRPHQALGDATLDPATDTLTVRGIDGQWDDGVEVGLDDVTDFNATIEETTLSAAGQGFVLSSRGTVDGTPDSPVGQLRVEHTGNELAVTPDFEPLYAEVGTQTLSGVTVGVYVDGFRVDTLEFDSQADVWMWEDRLEFGWGRYGAYGGYGGYRGGFGIGFTHRTTLEASDGTSAEGDAFTFEPTDADRAVESLSSVACRAASVESVTITDETTS